MARQPTGQVVWDPRRGTFGLRFRALGKRQYRGLGRCTRSEAEAELRHVLADVERGLWRPPDREPARAPEVKNDPTFHEFASEWFDCKRGELRAKTIADYSWRLTNHLLPCFAWQPLSRITVQEVDRYRQAKVREGVLSAESINKTLTLLSAVLEQAVEYELIDRNPAAGKRRRLRTTKPRRSYLDTAAQIAALLDAAGELDADGVDRSSRPSPHPPARDARNAHVRRAAARASCSRSAGVTSTSAAVGCGSPMPRPPRASVTFTYCRRCATS